jgi:hypothetical protein
MIKSFPLRLTQKLVFALLNLVLEGLLINRVLLLVQNDDNVTGLESRLLISLPAEDNLLTITSALVDMHFQHFAIPDNLQSTPKLN